jgi:hypothetical protein
VIAAPRSHRAGKSRLVAALTRERAAPRLLSAAFMRLLLPALALRRFGFAAALVNARATSPGFFRFELVPGKPAEISVVRIRFRSGQCLLGLNQHLPDSPRLDYMTRRLIGALPLLAASRGLPDGQCWLNLDDVSLKPGLAFSAAGPDYHLVPDPIYLGEQGYRPIARTYLKRDTAWADRRPVAFWRGSTSGYCAPGEWRGLARVKLCELTAARPDLFDVALGGLVQVTPEDAEAISKSGLLRPPVPEADFILYRYQIDIDGNSNSWPGLFGKLLTGSPVLKVESARGYRQWYYDRLIPWRNFVPVAADMSDLVERVEWLMAHDAEARRIGAEGRALALSMNVRDELRLARKTVAAALGAVYFRAEQPESPPPNLPHRGGGT